MFGRTRTHLECLSFPRLNLTLNLDRSQLYLLSQDKISWAGDASGVSGEILWVTDIYKVQLSGQGNYLISRGERTDPGFDRLRF